MNDTLTYIGMPPLIVVQPSSALVGIGLHATISVVALGTNDLQYQWLFNGVNIYNANAASLTIPSFQNENQGSYKVKIYNTYGHVTSNSIQLTVTLTPNIYLPYNLPFNL